MDATGCSIPARSMFLGSDMIGREKEDGLIELIKSLFKDKL